MISALTFWLGVKADVISREASSSSSRLVRRSPNWLAFILYAGIFDMAVAGLRTKADEFNGVFAFLYCDNVVWAKFIYL